MLRRSSPICSRVHMLGVFDSGRGGRHALCELRRLLPEADMAFLADTRHAPYGTKTPSELRALVTRDIRRLRAVGATDILCACCTASTVLPTLPASVRTRVMPIVRPTAEAAVAASHTHRYAVIATEATVRSDAFPRALCAADPAATVRSLAMPALVTLCEQSCTDPSEPRVRHALAPLVRLLDTYPADTLVLGCTHFSAFSEALTALLPPITLIASDRFGARAFAASLGEEQRRGHGITAEIM